MNPELSGSTGLAAGADMQPQKKSRTIILITAGILLALIIAGYAISKSVLHPNTQPATDFSVYIGGNESGTIQLFTSGEHGSPGPADVRLVNPATQQVIGTVTLPFPNGVGGVPLYLNQEDNNPIAAVTTGTQSNILRDLIVFNMYTGQILDQGICVTGPHVAVFRNDIYYSDCTPASLEIQKYSSDYTQSNVIQRNIKTGTQTILRTAQPWESYQVGFLTRISRYTEEPDTLHITKYSYHVRTEAEKRMAETSNDIGESESHEELVIHSSDFDSTENNGISEKLHSGAIQYSDPSDELPSDKKMDRVRSELFITTANTPYPGICTSTGEIPVRIPLFTKKLGNTCAPDSDGCQDSVDRVALLCEDKYVISEAWLSSGPQMWGVFDLKN